jgi:hypothetical protein
MVAYALDERYFRRACNYWPLYENLVHVCLDMTKGKERNVKYRKKPVVIEAYQTDKELDIETLEGTMHASVGDYIITGVRGEQYPCKPDIFEQTYEPADAPASPWHRVVERLPEPGKIVLACNDVGTVSVAYLASYGKWYAANNTMYDAWTWMPNVTRWMPFPEPPQED